MNRRRARNVIRAFLLILFFGSLVAAALPMGNLKVDNRFEIWFYQQDPNLQHYERGRALFGAWDWMSILVRPRQGVYSESFLLALRDIAAQIKALPDVKKVISVANAKGNRLEADELSYQSILGPAPWTPGDLGQLRKTLESNLAYRDGLIKPGSDRDTLVLVQVKNRSQDSEAYRIALLDRIGAILEAHRGEIENYALVGSPYLNAELNRSSRHDMYVFYPLVTLLVTIVAWIIFRNVRDVAVTLISLGGAMVWSVGLMMTRYELNMVTIMMPTILMTVAVANVMHVIVSFHQTRRAQPAWSAEEAMRDVRRRLWVPALGTTTTTAVGFLSLTQTGILPITLLGYFSALGIMFAYLLTFTLVPLLLVLFWDNPAKARKVEERLETRSLVHRADWPGRLAFVSFRHPYLALLLFAAIGAAILGKLSQLDADTNYVEMFHASTRVKGNYDTVKQAGYAANSITMLIDAPQGLEDEPAFRAVQALGDRIEALPETRTVLSPVKLIAEVDRALAEDRSRWTPTFPGYGREAFAQLMLTAEMSGNDDLADLLAPDHKVFQLTIFTDYMSSREVTAYAKRLQALAQETLPVGSTAAVTGLPVLWANMDRQLLASQSNIMISVVLPLAFIMLIILRSVPLVTIGLIVNLLPVGLILGLMAWLGIKINIATILIGGITMGIAVDDTIHFLWQYRNEVRDGKPFEEALRSTYRHTGIAIFLTALLLGSGFLVMATSDFAPTADFGYLTSITVIIALLVEILLMPALLVLYEAVHQRIARCREAIFGQRQAKTCTAESFPRE
jgi:predicted RND superfamily exporter protein